MAVGPKENGELGLDLGSIRAKRSGASISFLRPGAKGREESLCGV